MKVEKKTTRPRKKRETWEREPETSVRVGWQRWTTYYRKDSLAYLRALSDKRCVYVMDLLEEVISEYRKRHKGAD